MNKKHRFSGFTLIELLVVISIIGILSTLLIANFNAIRERSRDAQRKSDAKNIQTALRLYYNDAGSYPISSGDFKIVGCDAASCDWGTPWVNGANTYMNKLPIDPQSPDKDYHYSSTGGESYTLGVCLENSSGNACTSESWCSTSCVYNLKP